MGLGFRSADWTYDRMSRLVERLVERRWLDRKQRPELAHWLVVGTAAVLPWSTSALSILIGTWALIAIVTTNWHTIRAELATPVGGLPVVLFLFAVAGTFWSYGSPAERWDGFRAFLRFLAIPLLLNQYRRSGEGRHVLAAFMLSCLLLLIASYGTFLWGLPVLSPGVPVKNYITQSLEFAICAAILLPYARIAQRPVRAFVAAALAMAFLANIAFVATGRTTLVVIVSLILVFGFRNGAWKGTLIAGLTCLIAFTVLLEASPSLRGRVLEVYKEIGRAETNAPISSRERLAFWRKSLRFIEDAPIVGHGVGSIPGVYRNAAADQTDVNVILSDNPHNQTFTIGIQLGLVGVLLLWLSWLSQLVFFRHPGAIMWIGTVLVVQNIVGSLFNSFIFDFTEGWLYIIGVGVAAGMAFRQIPHSSRLQSIAGPVEPHFQ